MLNVSMLLVGLLLAVMSYYYKLNTKNRILNLLCTVVLGGAVLMIFYAALQLGFLIALS